jgi:hypothetical protein
VITVSGDLVMSNTATLRIELGGLTAGTEYDRLAVTGHAALDGTLRVSLTNAFAPAAGAAFDVLTYGSHSNAFATLVLPPLGAGDLWHVSYGSTSVTLRVLARSGDFDGDGLPNGWEYDHFGSATGAAPNALAANGVNTVREAYVADLDPNDPGSVFPPITNIEPGVWMLVIDSTSTARLYDVEWSTNLLLTPSPWTPYGFDRFGTGSNVIFVITNVGPVRFYRTTVRLP